MMEEEMCKMREKIARLEEKITSSEKALVLADRAIEAAAKANDSGWSHLLSIASLFISIIVLAMQFFKR